MSSDQPLSNSEPPAGSDAYNSDSDSDDNYVPSMSMSISSLPSTQDPLPPSSSSNTTSPLSSADLSSTATATTSTSTNPAPSNENSHSSANETVPVSSSAEPPAAPADHQPSNSTEIPSKQPKTVKFAEVHQEISHSDIDKESSSNNDSSNDDSDSDDSDESDDTDDSDTDSDDEDDDGNTNDTDKSNKELPAHSPSASLPAKPTNSPAALKSNSPSITPSPQLTEATPALSAPPTITPDYDNIDVPLFNDIVQFFITSPLLNDASFISKPPAEKQKIVIDAYEKDKNVTVDLSRVNLNFNATTSYNKNHLKPHDEYQLLVPINPYCRRPDITTPLSNTERQQYEKFKKDLETYSKEFECLDFPAGSRLFVGNLSVQTLSLVDVWRIFSKYGTVKAVNMKLGYGFVQYDSADSSKAATTGESNVPLHNKFMILQVSKTHEKHIENKDKVKEMLRDKSPVREPHAKKSENKVSIIVTTESDDSFNHLLVSSVSEIGIECNVKTVETDSENVPQETISESAYAGFDAVIVTCHSELVNLFLFQKNHDDSIKFDEYEHISLESAINFIKEQIQKNEKNKSRERDTKGNDRRKRRRKDESHENRNNRDFRDRDRGRGRNHWDRDYDRDHDRNHDRNHDRHRNHRDRYDHNDRRGRQNHNYNNADVGIRYSPGQQQAQKHLPPVIPGGPPLSNPIQQPPNMWQPQQQYPPPPPPPPHQQQYYPPPVGNNAIPGANNPVAAQLLNQISSLDSNQLKAMINMVNQYQQPQQQPAQQLPNSYSSQPSMYAPAPAPTANGVGGLLSQLQGMSHSPSQPYQQPQGSAQQQQQQYQPQQSSNSQSDDASQLFETLARLKNNM